jgi:hypothetical protein
MLTLVVFFLSVRRAVRRIKEQRHALRPVPPVLPADHVPCVVNTIGVCLTEFALVALSLLMTLVLANAVINGAENARSVSDAIQRVTYDATLAVLAVVLMVFFLSRGIRFALFGLLLLIGGGTLALLLMSSGGEQWSRVLIFALVCGGTPAFLIYLLRFF